MKSIKKWISMLLAFMLIMCAAISTAAADDEDKTTRQQYEEAATLNVTVPLYVCMYAYGGSGAVAVPSEDAYCIYNYTDDMAVRVTNVTGTNVDMALTDSNQFIYAGELYLQLNGSVVINGSTDVSWIVEKGAGENNDPGKLPIAINAAIGANQNSLGEKKACRVQYTLEPVWPYYETVYDINESQLTLGGPTNMTGVMPSADNVPMGETFEAADMALDGYIFKGWNTKPDGTGRTIGPGVDAIVYEDTTLYAQWDVDYEYRMHFSSDYLETGGASYDVVDWEDYGFVIELYNFNKENQALLAGADISYTVTANNGATVDIPSGSFGTTTAQTQAIHVIPSAGATVGDVITVTATADNGGATRTVTANFTLASREYAQYTAVDQGDGTVLLTIWTNDFGRDSYGNNTRNITINYAGFLPDNTNNFMSGWSGSSGTISVRANTVYELLFFKTTAGSFRDIDLTSVSGSAITLG